MSTPNVAVIRAQYQSAIHLSNNREKATWDARLGCGCATTWNSFSISINGESMRQICFVFIAYMSHITVRIYFRRIWITWWGLLWWIVIVRHQAGVLLIRWMCKVTLEMHSQNNNKLLSLLCIYSISSRNAQYIPFVMCLCVSSINILIFNRTKYNYCIYTDFVLAQINLLNTCYLWILKEL